MPIFQGSTRRPPSPAPQTSGQLALFWPSNAGESWLKTNDYCSLIFQVTRFEKKKKRSFNWIAIFVKVGAISQIFLLTYTVFFQQVPTSTMKSVYILLKDQSLWEYVQFGVPEHSFMTYLCLSRHGGLAKLNSWFSRSPESVNVEEDVLLPTHFWL
jgi:hypothetical protein